MKKLYRLVSSNVLEIYNLKGSGVLLFCKSVNPTEFNYRKILKESKLIIDTRGIYKNKIMKKVISL